MNRIDTSARSSSPFRRLAAVAALLAASAAVLTASTAVGSAGDDDRPTFVRPEGEPIMESPIPAEEAKYMLDSAGIAPSGWPWLFFECPTPWRIDLINWTKCTLYFITFHDCDGDGMVDAITEEFVPPYDPEANWPGIRTVESNDDCPMLYFGMFGTIPGGCSPGWNPDWFFPTAYHFTE